jgi:V-type H+-transporting ATPase subunit H
LTFELNESYTIRSDFAKDGVPVSCLVDLVSIAPREEVVRVALSSLRNIATCNQLESPPPSGLPPFDGTQFLSEMIACGLMKAIDHLKDRQFTDPDVIDGKLNFVPALGWQTLKLMSVRLTYFLCRREHSSQIARQQL